MLRVSEAARGAGFHSIASEATPDIQMVVSRSNVVSTSARFRGRELRESRMMQRHE